MKVLLVFVDGPVDGQTEEMEVRSMVPFGHFIRTRVGDRQVPGTNQANDAVYLFSRDNPTDPRNGFIVTIAQCRRLNIWCGRASQRRKP